MKRKTWKDKFLVKLLTNQVLDKHVHNAISHCIVTKGIIAVVSFYTAFIKTYMNYISISNEAFIKLHCLSCEILSYIKKVNRFSLRCQFTSCYCVLIIRNSKISKCGSNGKPRCVAFCIRDSFKSFHGRLTVKCLS